jgi:hypothetical protein
MFCNRRVFVRLGLAFVLLFPLAVCSGCGNTKVSVFFSADAPADKALALDIAAKANVDVADIQSLKVMVAAVNLYQSGNGQIPLLITPQDVDLMDLSGVSTLLSTVEVPAGTYTKISLSIENPRLALKSDPAAEITDIHLTANARMFVEATFTIPPNTNTNLVLDFGGIHLVQQGNGGYTLTPQLRAEISVELVPVTNQGVVVSVNESAGTMVLAIGDSEVTVNIAEAAIYLPGDTDTPTGTMDALAVGAVVSVEGTVDADGVIMATQSTVQPPAPTT